MVAGQTHNVSIGNFFFSPTNKTITVGDKVRWRNNGGGVIHTTTGPGWNSGQMGDGQTFTRTFNQAGSFSYLCTIHPANMAGTIIVEP